MIAEILSVGTELLLGDILNTNAQFLSQQLASIGINVYYQTTVGDNAERLLSAIEIAKQRCDLLIFSGGLGPTDDDLTKETVAKAFGDTLVLDKEILDKIQSFFDCSGRKMTHNNIKQAMVPVTGKIINNKNGTAPGAIFNENNKIAVVLPGPPNECEPMFLQEVKPWLAKLSGAVLTSITLSICGIGESALEEKIKEYLNKENPTTAVYAKTGEVQIRVTAKADTQEKAFSLAKETVESLKNVLKDDVYSTEKEDLAQCTVRILKEKNKAFAVAESCTGGLIAKMITDVPGSSAVFNYGACTYTEQIKQSVLGVNSNTLSQYGVVSAEVASEMAKSVLKIAKTDYAIGVTGAAGPDPAGENAPAGLVFIALASNEKIVVHKMMLSNRRRETVRTVAAKKALDMLRRALTDVDLSSYL